MTVVCRKLFSYALPHFILTTTMMLVLLLLSLNRIENKCREALWLSSVHFYYITELRIECKLWILKLAFSRPNCNYALIPEKEWAQRKWDRGKQSFSMCSGGWEGGSKWSRRISGVDTPCQDGVRRNPIYLQHNASPQKGKHGCGKGNKLTLYTL